MRRRILTATLATASLAALGAAPGQARVFAGTCAITGTLQLATPATYFSPFTPNPYTLDTRTGTCEGTLDGAPFSGKVGLTIAGSGNLSCEASGLFDFASTLNFDPDLAEDPDDPLAPVARRLRFLSDAAGPAGEWAWFTYTDQDLGPGENVGRIEVTRDPSSLPGHVSGCAGAGERTLRLAASIDSTVDGIVGPEPDPPGREGAA